MAVAVGGSGTTLQRCYYEEWSQLCSGGVGGSVRRDLKWSQRFQVARSKSLESVVACHVRMAPMGMKTKVETHMPMGPMALSRTDFSLIMPTT